MTALVWLAEVLFCHGMKIKERLLHFIHSVHSVFDADPSGVVDGCESFEDGWIVIEAFSRDAVQEDLGVSDVTVGGSEVFE